MTRNSYCIELVFAAWSKSIKSVIKIISVCAHLWFTFSLLFCRIAMKNCQRSGIVANMYSVVAKHHIGVQVAIIPVLAFSPYFQLSTCGCPYAATCSHKMNLCCLLVLFA